MTRLLFVENYSRMEIQLILAEIVVMIPHVYCVLNVSKIQSINTIGNNYSLKIIFTVFQIWKNKKKRIFLQPHNIDFKKPIAFKTVTAFYAIFGNFCIPDAYFLIFSCSTHTPNYLRVCAWQNAPDFKVLQKH